MPFPCSGRSRDQNHPPMNLLPANFFLNYCENLEKKLTRNRRYSLAPTNESIFLGNRWQKRDQVSMKPDGGSPLYTGQEWLSSIQANKSHLHYTIHINIHIHAKKSGSPLYRPTGVVCAIHANKSRVVCLHYTGQEWRLQRTWSQHGCILGQRQMYSERQMYERTLQGKYIS